MPFKCQFSISTHSSSIWSIDRTLSNATTPGQSGPGSNSNEGVVHIPQSPSFTGISPLNCFVSYTGYSLGVLSHCREAVDLFYSPSRLGKQPFVFFPFVLWLYSTLHNRSKYGRQKYLPYFKLGGAYDKFPDFFRTGTFIDITHIKL